MVIQSVVIPKDKFTLTEAKKYIKDHKYKLKKVDITTNYYRFRQVEPIKGRQYYDYKTKNGVILVLMY